ncbi:family 16 glycosylhydrolase [Psychromicrobium sp. YIM B11713]|uniref:family 16 glycosylhydrolase n=1 Tax=Psychromicrobium sp. YIM B11713 TaxID=3145233 RepID=UPI00374EB675
MAKGNGVVYLARSTWGKRTAAIIAALSLGVGGVVVASQPAVALSAAPEAVVSNWTDNFDGAAGSRPNSQSWNSEIGGTGWGNNERQYYTDSAANSSLDGNGNLVITARRDNTNGLNCFYGPCEVTSARLTTAGKITATYGRVEARIKVPTQSGTWPAFWMLGDDIGSVGWPQSGEIDVMENVGNSPNKLLGTLHGPGYSGGDGIGGEINTASPLGNDFHTYRVDWGPDRVTWFIDGTPYLSVGKEDLGGKQWVFNKPFFLILNLAIGGTLGGAVDLNAMPAQMVVDYVKVTDLGGANPVKSNPPSHGGSGGDPWAALHVESPAVSLQSVADGQAVEIDGNAANTQGARANAWDYSAGNNQRWQMYRRGTDNVFVFRSIGSTLVLDKNILGNDVQQYGYGGNTNQQWVFADAPGGSSGQIQIKSGQDGSCLTNKGHGQQLRTESCRNGDSTQVWTINAA